MSMDDLFNTLDEIIDTNHSKDTNDTNEVQIELKCCENHINFMYDEGIILCKICHNSITNIVDSPEWRYYGAGDSKNINPTRCGMPVNQLLPKSSLGTSVATSWGGRSEAMNRIGMYQRWNSMPFKERSRWQVFNEIQQKCQANNLPSIIVETAQSLYTIISQTKISRGANRKGIIAACVFHACKECKVPRSTNELAHIFKIEQKVMTKGCKNYTEIMRMSQSDKSRISNPKSITMDDFIERFSHALSLTPIDVQNILKIAEKCSQFKIINDNTPPGMAAGCIFLYIKFYGLDISKKQISDISKISEVTINKCYKKLENNVDIMNFLTS
jgi:transcription initiation factor TFIIB